jgi:ABC-type microcin C transport system permease subunit YejE
MSEQDAFRHAQLSWTAFRSRNFFIGSSVATAVGAALVFPAEANQCNATDAEGEMTLNRCTSGGKAMVLFGYPLLVFGGISMLTTGIVFGVMKGKLRRFEQRVARRESRTLRWDPARSRFVF